MADENEQVDNTTSNDTGTQDTGTVDKTPSNDEGGALLDRFMESTDGPKDNRGEKAPGGQGGQAPVQKPGETKEGAAKPSPGSGQGTGEREDVRQIPQAKRQYGSLFYADQRGDIYNAQGQLVAKQGYGRSVFHQMYPYIEALSTENASFKNRFDSYEKANDIAKQNGLTLDDYSAAMQLMVSWKKNKAETIKTLLNIAQETGTDVAALQSGGGISPAALRATMEELLDSRFGKFQPLLDGIEQQRIGQEENDAIMTQYTAFMEEFPDSAPHQGAIARVMRDHNYTPREAYYALRSVAAAQGLDWTQDLQPQLEAKTSGNGQHRPPGSGTDRALPPMSGGRNDSGAAPASGRGNGTGTGEESWDHILRQTFKQHGIDV